MKKIFSSILLFAVAILPVCVKAQDIGNYTNTVYGNYTPTVEDKEKVNVPLVVIDTLVVVKPTIQHDVPLYRLSSVYTPTTLKPARVNSEHRSTLYPGYLRLGFGTYVTPLADFYLNTTKSTTSAMGLRLNHRSTWGSIGPEDEPALFFGPGSYSLTDFGLFGKWMLNRRNELRLGLDYEHDYHLFYGFSDSTLTANGLSRDDIATSDYSGTYHYFAANIGLSRIDSAVFHYDINAKVSDLIGSFSQNEFGLNFDATLSLHLKYGGKRAVATEETTENTAARSQSRKGAPSAPNRISGGRRYRFWFPSIRFTLDGYSQKASSDAPDMLGYSKVSDTSFADNSSRLLMGVNPYVLFPLGRLHARVGLNLALDRYTFPDEMMASIHPDITLSGAFFRGSLGFALGAVGSHSAVTWNSLRLKNPYVEPNAELRAMGTNKFFIDFRYSMTRHFEMRLGASYTLHRDDPSFRLSPDYNLHNVFRVKYEDFNLTKVGAEFAYHNDDLFDLTIGGHYYWGEGANGDELPALYRYTYDADLTLSFHPWQHWNVSLQSTLLSPMHADYDLNTSTNEYVITATVPMRLGFDLDVEYATSDFFSLFLRIENITAQRYFYWENYPSQKIMAMIGLTCTFHKRDSEKTAK